MSAGITAESSAGKVNAVSTQGTGSTDPLLDELEVLPEPELVEPELELVDPELDSEPEDDELLEELWASSSPPQAAVSATRETKGSR